MMKDSAPNRGKRAGSAQPAHTGILALQVLAFFAADEAVLQRFMATTGLDPADVRASAAEPGFQRGLLSYLVADDDLLVRFATAQGLKPDDVARTVLALDSEEQSYDIRAR